MTARLIRPGSRRYSFPYSDHRAGHNQSIIHLAGNGSLTETRALWYPALRLSVVFLSFMLHISVQWCWDKHPDTRCAVGIVCFHQANLNVIDRDDDTQISIAAVSPRPRMDGDQSLFSERGTGIFFFFFFSPCASFDIHKIPHWSFPAEPQRFRSETLAVAVCVNNANWVRWVRKLSCLNSRPVFLSRFPGCTQNYCVWILDGLYLWIHGVSIWDKHQFCLYLGLEEWKRDMLQPRLDPHDLMSSCQKHVGSWMAFS